MDTAITRRDLVKAAGAAGLATVVGAPSMLSFWSASTERVNTLVIAESEVLGYSAVTCLYPDGSGMAKLYIMPTKDAPAVGEKTAAGEECVQRVDDVENGKTALTALQRSIKEAQVIGSPRPTTTRMWFYGMENCTSIDLEGIDTSACTDMSCMFDCCSSLESLDLSGFDFGKVASVERMFNCNRNLERVFVPAGTDLSALPGDDMFLFCNALAGGEGTAFSATHTGSAYARVDGLDGQPGYLTQCAVNAVTVELDEPEDFMVPYELLFVSSPRTPRVGERMPDGSGTVVEVVEDVEGLGPYPALTSEPLAVSAVRTLCSVRPLSTVGWFLGFEFCSEMDLSLLDTSRVEGMEDMFNCCTALSSLDVSHFDTSSTTSMDCMFADCSSLESVDVGSFNTSRVTGMYGMFNCCSSLTSLDLSSFDTAAVGTMRAMFSGCSKLASLDLSGWDTSRVTDMHSMFYDCCALESLDVGSFATAGVSNMGDMFYGCTALLFLDLSSFDTARVASMRAMFSGCGSLETVYAGEGWSTEQCTSSESMFHNCTAIVGGNGTAFSSDHTDASYARVDGLEGLPGYFSAKE